jgi:hypothetical protein
MKIRICLLALALLASNAAVSAADLANHVFFKHLVGKWKAEGELKGGDSNVVKITEEWTGKADADGSFYIEGSRTVNGDTQPFKWSITHNPAIDGYEAVLSGAEGSQTLRFEGSLSEVDLTMTLKSITGSGESSITVEDSFANETKDTLQSKIKFSGDQGQTNLEGTILHKREKTS